MREPRNPFRLRASEHIESDATFLRLFEPGMLMPLPKERLWERVQIIRSAPGGGKTSLMRLFTPSALLALHSYRTKEHCKELHQQMQELGVITDAGPRILGVLLSCANNYATLDDMDMDAGRRERLLFGLLNARIVLAALRNALALKRLNFPSDLPRLMIKAPPNIELPPGLKLPGNGQELYDWAKGVESQVYEAIDSLDRSPAEKLPGHETLVSLLLMAPSGLTLDGEPVADRVLVMFDDFHKVTRRQRAQILRTIIDMRSPVDTWIAERLEALSPDEMLSSGASQGRDYESVISLENFWREGKRFEKFALRVADRRASSAVGVDIPAFGPHLESSLESPAWEGRFADVLKVVRERVITLAGATAQFREWIAVREAIQGTAYERLVSWRTLEILIERERRKAQGSFDFSLSPETLEKKDDSAVNAAAELFLAKEFGLPYYYGPAQLAALASSNIEQFLSLAGEEFEEVASAAIIKKEPVLAAERQQRILQRAALNRLEEIPRRVRNGREVLAFVEAIAEFAQWKTYLPNAPYSPGVTGIAVTMAEREELRNPEKAAKAGYSKLANVIAAAIANNLLEPSLDYRCQGENLMVLNINRLFCVHYKLPLQYGGFKRRTIKELSEWIDGGFKIPKKSDDFL